MLTPSANFTNAFKNSEVHPIFIIYITIGSTTYGYVSGQKPIFGYDPVVMDVSHGAPEIDIIERTMTVGSFSITFAPDDVFKDFLVANKLPGRKVVIKLGTYALDEVDFFQPYPPLMVKDIQPSINKIVLECEDFTTLISDREIGDSQFIAQHPYSVIQLILGRAGVPVSYIDTTTLDPGDAGNSDIAHHTVSRLSTELPFSIDNAFKARHNPLEAINELSTLTRSTFHVNTSGLFTVKKYNQNRVVDRHIPQEKIIELTQGTLAENLANNILYTLAERKLRITPFQSHDPSITDVSHTTTWSRGDYLSQLTHTPIGSYAKQINQEYSSAWLNGASRIFFPEADPVSNLQTAQNIGSFTTSFVLVDAGLNGFAGLRHRKPTSLSDHINPSEANLDNTHLCYLLLEGSAIYSPTTSTINAQSNGDTVIGVTNATNFRIGDYISIGTSTRHQITDIYYRSLTISPGLVGNQLAGVAVTSFGIKNDNFHREVISCNDITIDRRGPPTNLTQVSVPEPGYSNSFHDYRHFVPAHPRFHIYQRALFDTTSPYAWQVGGSQIAADSETDFVQNRTVAWDITIPVLVTNDALTRFTNGAPRFRVRLPLSEIDIEFGDFLTFDYDKFFMFGKSSLDNSSVFEVMKVEHQLTGSSPGVYLDVAWVRNDLSYTPNLTYQTMVPMPRIGSGPVFIVDNNGDPIFIDSNNLISI